MDNQESLIFHLRAKDHATPVLKSFESAIIRTVGAISAAIAGITAIAFPIRSAAEFQQQMLNVKKTTDLASDTILLLGKSLVELSTQTNVTAVDLAKIAEAGGRMGIQETNGVAGLLEFTKQVSILATALDLSADEVATSMGKLSNIFALTTEQFAKAGAVINQLDNESTATASEIFDIMRRIGNLGGSVRFDQSAALAATAVDLGLTAETAGTTLTKIFADMKSQASDFASFMGVTTQEWVESVTVDGIGALRSFVNQLNKMPAEVAAAAKVQLTGGGRIFEFITKLQAQVAQGSSSILDRRLLGAEEELAKGTSAIKEQQSVLTGLTAQWQVFLNKISSVAITGGGTVLYDLTQGIIRLGDFLSNEEFTSAFADAVDSLGYALNKVINTVVSFASAMQVSWREAFDIGKIALFTAVLEKARVALVGFAAARGLKGISAPDSVLASAAKREKDTGGGAAGLGSVAGLTQERTSLGLLTAAYRAYANQKAEVKAKTDAVTAAKAAEAAATVGIVRAESDLAAVRQKLSNSGTRVKTNNATLQAATAPLLAAQDYYTRKVAAQQQLLQAREATHQQALAAITGRGSAARIASLQAAYDAQTQALLVTQERQRVQYQVHYERLIAQQAAAMQTMRAAEAAVPRLAAGYNRAKAQLQPALAAVPAAKELQKATRDALKAAEDEVKKSTLRGKIANLFSAAPGGGIAAFNTAVTAPFAAYSTATTTAGKVSAVAAGGVSLLGTALVGTAKAAVTAASVIARLAGAVFKLYIFYEIGKALLNATGLMDGFVSKVNSAIAAVNRLTGLKIPTIGGNAAGDKQILDSLAERKKRLDDSSIAADKFNKVYGSIDLSKSLDVNADKPLESFGAQVAKRAEKIKSDAQRIFDGVKFDITKGNDPFVFIDRGVALVNDLNAKIVNTRLLFEAEAAQIAKVTEELNAQSAAQRKANADKKRLAEELNAATNPVQQAADSTIIFGASRNKAAEIQEKLTEAVKAEEIATSRVLAVRKTIEASEAKSLKLATEAVSLVESRDLVITATASALGPQAYEQLWKKGKDGADAFVDQIHNAAAEVAQLTLGVEAAQKEINQLNTNDSPDASKLSAANYAYEIYSSALSEAKAKQEGLMQSAEQLSAIQEISSEKNRRATVERIVGLGREEQVMGAMLRVTKLRNAEEAAARVLAGSATVKLANRDADYRALLGQRLLAKDAAAAYRQLAEVATAAAEKAKRAVTEAMDKSRQDMEDLKKAAIDSANTLKQNIANANLVKSGRVIDERSGEKLNELEIEKKREQDILDLLKAQGQISEANFARRKLDLDQEYARKSNAITDAASDEKAKESAKGQVKIFNETKEAVGVLQERLASLAERLNDLSIPASERAALIEPFHTATAELEAQLKVMANAKTAIEGLATSTGLPPVPKSTLESMQEALTLATQTKNVAEQRAAKPQEQILATQAARLQEGAAAAEDKVKAVDKALNALAERSGVSVTKISEDLARLSQDPSFLKIKEEFQALAAEGSIKVGLVGFDTKEFSEKLKLVAKEMEGKRLDINTIVEIEPLRNSLIDVAKEFRKQLTAPVKDDAGNDKANPVPISLSLDAAAEAAKITAQMGLVVLNGKIIVKEVVGADGKITYVNSTATFAEGGLVRGPGTGTSDSIDAKLSDGEYVSDALTTKTFTPKFFGALKSFAKSGNPLGIIGWLSRAVPRIATPQLATASVGGSIPEIGNIGSLNITMDRKPVGRVMGTRETLDSLVTAISTMSKGL